MVHFQKLFLAKGKQMNRYTRAVLSYDLPSHYCTLNLDRLEEAAQDFARQDLKAPAWREAVFPQDDDDTFLNFIGVANALNFCFIDFTTGGKFDVEYPRGSSTRLLRGSFALFAALKRALDEGIPILDPTYLAHLSEEDARGIFECKNTPLPMFDERIHQLRNIGMTLLELELIGFAQLFKKAGFRAFNHGFGIVEVLVREFDAYRDEWPGWGGHLLPFHKRAQLLPLMYAGRALASGGKLPLLADPESIGPISEYIVPNTLRSPLGIFEYEPEFERSIDAHVVIEKGCAGELEIRARTTEAMVLLLKRINQLRRNEGKDPITMVELDYQVWGLARQAKTSPHWTLTKAY